MKSARKSILAISSHVDRGHVGNRAIVFPLERLGFTVWAVPTIILPFHLGHGQAERIVPDERVFRDHLQALAADRRAGDLAGVISGFLSTPEQARSIAAFIAAVKAENPEILYLCDPVIGDHGDLYVAEEVAAAVRDHLLPLADMATPNAFECAWFAGETGAAATDQPRLARRLAASAVLVTSAEADRPGRLASLLVEPDRVTRFEHASFVTPAKGTGDILAALLLARRIQGRSWAEAAERALSGVAEIVRATAAAGADELLIPDNQSAIVDPSEPVEVAALPA